MHMVMDVVTRSPFIEFIKSVIVIHEIMETWMEWEFRGVRMKANHEKKRGKKMSLNKEFSLFFSHFSLLVIHHGNSLLKLLIAHVYTPTQHD